MMINWGKYLKLDLVLSNEKFLSVIGFEDDLQFSNFKRLWRKKDNKILTPYYKNRKYICYSVSLKNAKILYEHFLVWQYYNRQPLMLDEVIHHVDGNYTNNFIANLEVMDRSHHMSEHRD